MLTHLQVKVLQAVCFLTEEEFDLRIKNNDYDHIDLFIIGGGQLWRGMLLAIAMSEAVRRFRESPAGMPEFQIWLIYGEVSSSQMQQVCTIFMLFIYKF